MPDPAMELTIHHDGDSEAEITVSVRSILLATHPSFRYSHFTASTRPRESESIALEVPQLLSRTKLATNSPAFPYSNSDSSPTHTLTCIPLLPPHSLALSIHTITAWVHMASSPSHLQSLLPMATRAPMASRLLSSQPSPTSSSSWLTSLLLLC